MKSLRLFALLMLMFSGMSCLHARDDARHEYVYINTLIEGYERYVGFDTVSRCDVTDGRIKRIKGSKKSAKWLVNAVDKVLQFSYKLMPEINLCNDTIFIIYFDYLMHPVSFFIKCNSATATFSNNKGLWNRSTEEEELEPVKKLWPNNPVYRSVSNYFDVLHKSSIEYAFDLIMKSHPTSGSEGLVLMFKIIIENGNMRSTCLLISQEPMFLGTDWEPMP